MRSIILTLIFLSSSLCWSNEISVGGLSVTIPPPEGFSAVTPEMKALYEAQKQFVAPMNEEFVTFIPEDFVEGVLRSEIPEMPRRFAVQTAKNLISVTVTSADFEALKRNIKSENTQLLKRVEAQIPELMGKVNDGIKEKYDVDLALSVSQMVPLPVHDETDRTLSYSALVKYEMKDEMGNPAPFVVVVTATFVHIKGKVLFFYSYAEESGLEWSQQVSRKWANDVVLSNPSDLQSNEKEAKVFGIDWWQVAVAGIVAGVVGLIASLLAALGKRSKSRK